MAGQLQNVRRAAVFDSGIGGLNLLYACYARVPDIKYYYFSDNANVPYGNRSPDEIYKMTLRALEGVEELEPSVLVIACNTVTALCIEKLRARYPFPVVGIQPAVKQAAAVGGRCLVLATNATANSPAFKNLAARFAALETCVRPCRELAAFVEKTAGEEAVPEELLPHEKADSLVLGCTHYAFIRGQLTKFYNCPVFDGISGTADHFAKILGIDDHLPPLLGKTAHTRDFKSNITFIGGDVLRNEHIFKHLLQTSV